ncbi:MAG TPA: hypothetical protein VFB32_08600 [Rudaea sp.]|nr:hypothetical protein [Rudaea sp.]
MIATPTLADGTTLEFYTDSGGGANMLCRDVALRLGLELTPLHDEEAERELGTDLATAHMPRFRPGRGIPGNADGDDTLLVHNCTPRTGHPAGTAGFLSSRWFDRRIWTWDYPGADLRLEKPGFAPPKDAHRIAVHFKTDSAGKRAFAMGRIGVRIDGESLDMLLDTGASATLSTNALATLGDHLPAQRAISFIVHSRFERWMRAHPDWRVIDGADSVPGARVIEVPSVDIAGFRVGPVLFAERGDDNLHRWMAQMMDGPTEGAIGGNVFQHFTMTVDYPAGRAYFRCMQGCAAAR